MAGKRTRDPLGGLVEELEELRRRGLARRMRLVGGGPGARAVVDGREVLNFSSNDYLGLAADERARAAAVEAIGSYGAGAGSARLIAGTFPVHRTLEEAIAGWKGTEAALLFSSGYHANLGVIGALGGERDVILSDALNHASIIDGCRLARARKVVVRHADAGAFGVALAEARGAGARRIVLVTDTVFGMDGDTAPVAALARAAAEHDAVLMVDEAHASGVLGPAGRGVAAAAGVPVDSVHVHMGTLGKALGSSGAFVAGSRALIDWLVHRARPFVFTTAPAPAAAAAALAALRIAASAEGDELRARLAALAARFRAGVEALGLRVPPGGETPIVPILIGDPHAAVRACEALLERRVWAQAIRPPTVPPGTERLRFAFTAAHGPEDVDAALAALAAVRAALPGSARSA